jgi:hypothetical protein
MKLTYFELGSITCLKIGSYVHYTHVGAYHMHLRILFNKNHS